MAIGFLYRWEDHNHGLEHKCGTCATVLSSPRAKKTCFGTHEEVCTRYHKTLFYVGQSHHCDACRQTIELHDKRHREIAAIIQNIQSLDGIFNKTQPLQNKRKRKGRRRRDSLNELDIENDSKALSEERDVQWDNESSTVNDDDPKEWKHDWKPEARRVAKAERRAAKNQVRFNVIIKDNLDRIEDSLHPEFREAKAAQMQNGQGLSDNKIIDENLAFGKHTSNWSNSRQGISPKKLAKANDPKQPVGLTLQDEDGVLAPMLARLGIKTNLSKATKHRKSLDNKLRAAIIEDLVALDNERAETMQRMAGYWRYANRRTYNEMVKNNELWDWATGAKLPEIEEESELDHIQEDEEDLDESTLVRNSHGTSTPEGWNGDKDVVLSHDRTLLSLDPHVDSASFGEDDDGLKIPTRHGYRPDAAEDKDLMEFARERMDKLSLPKLKSAFHSPNVAIGSSSSSSPSSSNSSGYCFGDLGTLIQASTAPKDISHNARSPLHLKSSITKTPAFGDKKDERSAHNARLVREASPPQEDSSPAPRAFHRISSPATILPVANDIGNRYGRLKNDTPPPCEEVRKVRVPLKHAVIIIPRQVDRPQVTVDDGWQEIRGGKRKKAFPELVKQPTKAARDAKKAGRGMDFVSAAKKNMRFEI